MNLSNLKTRPFKFFAGKDSEVANAPTTLARKKLIKKLAERKTTIWLRTPRGFEEKQGRKQVNLKILSICIIPIFYDITNRIINQKD